MDNCIFCYDGCNLITTIKLHPCYSYVNFLFIFSQFCFTCFYHFLVFFIFFNFYQAHCFVFYLVCSMFPSFFVNKKNFSSFILHKKFFFCLWYTFCNDGAEAVRLSRIYYFHLVFYLLCLFSMILSYIEVMFLSRLDRSGDLQFLYLPFLIYLISVIFRDCVALASAETFPIDYIISTFIFSFVFLELFFYFIFTSKNISCNMVNFLLILCDFLQNLILRLYTFRYYLINRIESYRYYQLRFIYTLLNSCSF